MLLVIIIDSLNGLDTWVVIALVVLARVLFVPIKDLMGDQLRERAEQVDTYSADERRDESYAGFSASDCLSETKEEGEVAVYFVVPF